MRRATAALLGGGTVAFGVAATVAPGLVGGVRFSGLLIVGVWVGTLVLLALTLVDQIGTVREWGTPLPRAGERPAYPTPGDELAAEVAQLGPGERDMRGRDAVRARLRRVAVRAVAHAERVDEERAREYVATGEWTDDESAERLFVAENGPASHERVEPNFEEQVERAAAAIARLTARSDGAWPRRRPSEDGPVEAEDAADGTEREVGA